MLVDYGGACITVEQWWEGVRCFTFLGLPTNGDLIKVVRSPLQSLYYRNLKGNN